MLVIGEKINIITKKIAQAIEERNPGPIQEIAKVQVEAGADVLDVNIGPARRNGSEIMEWLSVPTSARKSRCFLWSIPSLPSFQYQP